MKGLALMLGAIFAALIIVLPIALCMGGCGFFSQEPVCSAQHPCPYGPLPQWNGPDDRPLYLARDAGPDIR